MEVNRFVVVSLLVGALVLAPAMASGQIIMPPEDVPCFIDPSQPKCQPEPVIVVPGILASLNFRTIFFDETGGSWRFIPGAAATYRALIERLEGVGYEQGVDLFVAHYDWRQSNAESAIEYLIPAIEQAKQVSGREKVDIVAHSMGGLVARQYVRSAQYADDVDQLVLLGTPNEGTADAYIAWEGGDFPDRWSPLVKSYLDLVEFSLKRVRDVDLGRPLSFRAFFPSLRDMLPINDFIKQDGTVVAVGELTEQNPFLERLRDDYDLISQRGVLLRTIGGSSLGTLEQVPVVVGRTPEDEELERWRDGHPEPDPPQVDSTAGDQTVLLSSALLGSSPITIDNIEHDALPEEAQEEVLSALGLDVAGPHLAYERPASMLGTLVLSPVELKITGPNGEVLSKSENSFPNAEFVDDEGDPLGPKMLVVADPPVGDYTLELTGMGDGEYEVITVYADEDETVSVEQQGTTTAGQVTEQQLVVTEDSAVLVEEEEEVNGRELLREIIELTVQGQRDRVVRARERVRIVVPARVALMVLNRYDRLVERDRERPAQRQLRIYNRMLDRIKRTADRITGTPERKALAGEIELLLEKIRTVPF